MMTSFLSSIFPLFLDIYAQLIDSHTNKIDQYHCAKHIHHGTGRISHIIFSPLLPDNPSPDNCRRSCCIHCTRCIRSIPRQDFSCFLPDV